MANKVENFIEVPIAVAKNFTELEIIKETGIRKYISDMCEISIDEVVPITEEQVNLEAGLIQFTSNWNGLTSHITDVLSKKFSRFDYKYYNEDDSGEEYKYEKGLLFYHFDWEKPNLKKMKLHNFEFPVWVLKSPHPDYEEGSFFSEDVISSETYLGEL